MKKMVNFLTALAVGAAFVLSQSSAQSTSNSQLLSQNRIFNKINAIDVANILSEFEITSQLMPAEEGGQPALFAQSATGPRFIVTFLNCDQPQAVSCNDFAIFTAMSSSGLTFDDINEFNAVSDAARAYFDQQNQLIIFDTHVVVLGGAGRDNIALNIALYFTNLNNYFANRSATASSVSFSDTVSSSSKILGPQAEYRPSEVPNLYRASENLAKHQISAAIHNRWSMRFPEMEKTTTQD